MIETSKIVNATNRVDHNAVIEEIPLYHRHIVDAADYMYDYLTLNLDADSGNTTFQLSYQIPNNVRVRLATASIKGSAYSGPLRTFSGASVRASGIEYSTNHGTITQQDSDSQKAFVIDFGGMRKVSELQITDTLSTNSAESIVIELVLPWMGIEFGEKPLFPFDKDKPHPDSPGKTLVKFPETETAKLFVQLSGDISEPVEGDRTVVDEVLDHISIKSNTCPLNVRVAIADRPPFFTHAGEMIGEKSLPDFSAEVNAYLDELTASGVTSVDSIPLTVTTDLPGVITLLEGHQLSYDCVATAKWNESTRLPINFLHQEEKEVILEFPASGNDDWQMNGLSMEITHDFPEWRTFPRVFTDVVDNIVAKVAPDYNIAQRITVNESTELHGINLHLTEVNSDAELSLELIEDLNGVPGEKAVHSEIIAVPATSQIQWFDVFFSKPLKTTAGKHIWFVVKSKTGLVGIVLEAVDTTESSARFNRHGAGWKKFPYNQGQLTAAFRQLRKPAAGEDARVVELEVSGKTVRTDLVEEVNTVTFSFFNKETGVSTGPTLTPQNGKTQLKLKIAAHAAGTMTLQNVKIQYQTTAEE